MRLRELHLFAGIGGGILGGMLLGNRCVGAVELDPYCRRVLEARQRDGLLEAFPIYEDVSTFDGNPWRGRVDVVAGGFPCQDISTAGKGAGLDGKRSGLWWHMHRIIREVEPRYVFVENVAALLVRGFDRVLGSLADLGFDAEWCVRSAADCGAPHLRKRLWLLAAHPGRVAVGPQPKPVAGGSCSAVARHDGEHRPMADADGNVGRSKAGHADHGGGGAAIREGQAEPGRRSEAMADADGRRREGERIAQPEVQQGARRRESDGRRSFRELDDAALADAGGEGLPASEREESRGTRPREDGRATAKRRWWSAEPRVGRVANGVPSRVDQLRALGNAQVPIVAATAFAELMARLEDDNRARPDAAQP